MADGRAGAGTQVITPWGLSSHNALLCAESCWVLGPKGTSTLGYMTALKTRMVLEICTYNWLCIGQGLPLTDKCIEVRVVWV